MARVTITLEDEADGRVRLGVLSEPPFAKWDDDAKPTPAQRVAACVVKLVETLTEQDPKR